MNKPYIFLFFLLAAFCGMSGCKKEAYSFGAVTAPSELVMTTEVAGSNATNPNGDGSGNVKITLASKGALTYQVDFGNGIKQVVPSGTITYKYALPGTNSYTITVNAVGTGGALSTISKKVKVFVAFEIPQAMLSALTNGSSQVWVTNKEALGHFGVGPADQFEPIWYAAPPNSREACAYDDEIRFTKNANNTVSMTIDNKGTSFSIGAATGVYGASGGDGCYAINTADTRVLAFANATSNSTTSNSTRTQFTVPGHGMVNFGTGGTTYEILSISPTEMHLRTIGVDGNAWYQKLTVK